MSPAKFTFAKEFTSEAMTRESEIARLKAQLPQAELKGYEAGKNDASAIALSRLAIAIEEIANKAGTLLATLDKDRAALEGEAIELALTAAKSLARQLIEREPADAVHQLAVSCIESLRKSPHIVFRVNAELVGPVEEQLKKLAFERGLESRLIVLGEPETAAGDCKIEWAEGAFQCQAGEIEKKIDDAVARYIANKLSLNPATTEEKDE